MSAFLFFLGASIGSAAAFVGRWLASVIAGSNHDLIVSAAGLMAFGIPAACYSVVVARHYARCRAISPTKASSDEELSDAIFVEVGLIVGGLIVCYGGIYGTMFFTALWS
jgi:hypothetical protein